MRLNCSKCRYFHGYDGVNELWTSCSIHGDFKVKKTSCPHFKMPGRLFYLVVSKEGIRIALFFDKESAFNFVKQVEKQLGFKLLVVERQLRIREV